jgi:hypothetical protein
MISYLLINEFHFIVLLDFDSYLLMFLTLQLCFIMLLFFLNINFLFLWIQFANYYLIIYSHLFQIIFTKFYLGNFFLYNLILNFIDWLNCLDFKFVILVIWKAHLKFLMFPLILQLFLTSLIFFHFIVASLISKLHVHFKNQIDLFIFICDLIYIILKNQIVLRFFA